MKYRSYDDLRTIYADLPWREQNHLVFFDVIASFTPDDSIPSLMGHYSLNTRSKKLSPICN